ncbi:MAG: ribbon-helix-helix protein, CopG family [Proteobacteria bacterium]|nr:ribbon-helix-helix protein, CopG family [Pseudomonadota bacterium]
MSKQQLEKLEPISSRISKDLLSSIDEIARLRNRNRGEIVREALSFYADMMADYQIAIDRLKDPTDSVQTEKEFLKDLEWNI